MRGGDKKMIQKLTNLKQSITQKQEKLEIRVTTDYSQFSLVNANRMIIPSHVKNIIESIKQRNLLMYEPILVNEQKQVVDGQHRWLAAQQLGVPLYYIVANDISFEDITLLNNVVRSWRPMDYVNHYCDLGYEDYILLREFAEKWGFSMSNASAILTIGTAKTLKSKAGLLQLGDWKVSDLKDAEWFAKAYKEMAVYTEEKTAKDRDLMNAFYRMYFVLDLGIVHEDFMEQLKVYPQPIYRRLGLKEYLRQFEDIYNYGRKRAIRFM